MESLQIPGCLFLQGQSCDNWCWGWGRLWSFRSVQVGCGWVPSCTLTVAGLGRTPLPLIQAERPRGGRCCCTVLTAGQREHLSAREEGSLPHVCYGQPLSEPVGRRHRCSLGQRLLWATVLSKWFFLSHGDLVLPAVVWTLAVETQKTATKISCRENTSGLFLHLTKGWKCTQWHECSWGNNAI